MNAKTTAVVTVAVIAAMVVALLVYAGIASAISANSSGNFRASLAADRSGHWMPGLAGNTPFPNFPGGRAFNFQSAVNISVGQAITITSTQGKYWVVGNPSQNGTASGTLTFTVTSKLSQGYTLSITSGNILVAGTEYTLSSGTAQMGRFATNIVGQGTTAPSGQFLLSAQAQGSFAGTSGRVSLDLQTGTTEYAVILVGTVQD